MTKTKAIHPADAADLEAIKTAVAFNVHLRFGPKMKVNKGAATQAEAEAIADELAARYRGKVPAIYAITPTGASIPVPRSIQNRSTIMNATNSPLSGLAIDKVRGEIIGQPVGRSRDRATALGRLAGAIFDQSDPDTGLTREKAQAIAEMAAANTTVSDAVAAIRSAVAAPPRICPGASGGHQADVIPIVPGGGRRGAPAEPANATAEAKAKAKAKEPGKRAAAEAAAAAGNLPTPPDFSAETHKAHRKLLAEIVAKVEAGDIEGLKAFQPKTYSSSQKAIGKYRDLAVLALEARAAQ